MTLSRKIPITLKIEKDEKLILQKELNDIQLIIPALELSGDMDSKKKKKTSKYEFTAFIDPYHAYIISQKRLQVVEEKFLERIKSAPQSIPETIPQESNTTKPVKKKAPNSAKRKTKKPQIDVDSIADEEIEPPDPLM